VLTAVFLKFWRPRHEWHFDKEATKNRQGGNGATSGLPARHEVEAAAVPSAAALEAQKSEEQPLTLGNVSLAWAPYAIMSVLLLCLAFKAHAAHERGARVARFSTYLFPDEDPNPNHRLHARAQLRDALRRHGCDPGRCLCGNRPAVSFLRGNSRLARRISHGN